MEEKAVKGGFGFTLDFDDRDIKEKLVNFVEKSINNRFEEACEKFISEVEVDNWHFDNKIKEIFGV